MKIRQGLWALLFLMLIQSAASLLVPIYRDIGWVRETWLGNDIITLAVVCPLLLYALATRRNSGRSLALGVLGYAIYNYAYYLLGAQLNALFALYVAITILAAIMLIAALVSKNEFASALGDADPGKGYAIPAAIFLFIGVGLGFVWIANWATHVFSGKDLPQSPEVFRLVASLDLVLMVAPLVGSALFFFKKHRYGLRIGMIIGIQAFLYLMVLCLNSVLISAKAGNFPGELPVWGTLILIEGIGAAVMFANLRRADFKANR